MKSVPGKNHFFATSRASFSAAVHGCLTLLFVALVWLFQSSIAVQAQVAAPESAGCTSANTGAFDFTLGAGQPITPSPFNATFTFGEVVTFTLVTVDAQAIVTDTTSAVTILNIGGGGGASADYSIPADGARSFNLQLGTNDFAATLTVRCTVLVGVTSTTVQIFHNRRIRLLITEEPDRPRLVRREPGRLYGNGSGIDASAYSNPDGSSRLQVSTSLSSIAQAFAHANSEKGEGLGLASAVDTEPARSGVDIWVEGHYSFYEHDVQNVNSDGEFGVVYVGADVLYNPDFLIGALVQIDWIRDKSDILNSLVSGHGWMAGPYISARIAPNLYFDARAAWGKASNNITAGTTTITTTPGIGTTLTSGIASGSYDSMRWLVRANLTGNWQRGDWRITPSVSATYIEESYETFFNSIGMRVAGQTFHSGRITFGPEISHRSYAASGTMVERHMSFNGIWDFFNDGGVLVGQTIVGPDDFHGRIEGGILRTATDGRALRLVASYDGIGSEEYHSYGAQLWFNVPLN